VVKPALVSLVALLTAAAASGPLAQELAIPEVVQSAKRTIRVDDEARVRHIDSLAVAPDGDRFAVLVRQGDASANRYRTAWFVGSTRGGPLVRVGDGGEAFPKVMHTGHTPGVIEANEARWSPDGVWIAHTLRRDGQVQLWRSRADGSLQEQLTRNAADVREFAWAEDGRSLYFTAGTARVELEARELTRARQGYRFDEDLWSFLDFTQPRLVRAPETDLAVWIVGVEDRHERLADEGERAAFAKRRAAEPAVPDAVAACITPRCTAVRNQAVEDELAACRRAGSRLLCARQTLARPPHLVAVDLSSGALSEVADVNPEFRNIRLGRVERFEWDTPRFEWNEAGGRLEGLYPKTTHGYILYPPDFDPSRKHAVFIDPYMARGFTALGGEHPLHTYAASGLVVLRLQSPLPIDSWRRLGPSAMKQMYSRDLGFPHLSMLMESTVAGLRAAASRGFTDSGRVGIGGVSHGTFVPLYLMQKHDLIAAISISSPGWGPHSYYATTLRARQWSQKAGFESWAVKPEGEGREFWREIDIADHVGEIEAPILMHLAAHESYAHLPLIRHLADAGKPYDAYVFASETHVKWQPAHLHAIMNRNLDWFRFWLLGHEDDDPAKAEQYARWRALRSPPPS
jgi:dipeptidyl aminopeptidase/acylaminoacyl peptidase